MPNIVECPICDTKYDISGLKDGMKLKCTRCHKVVGTVNSGELLPILETIKAPTLPAPRRQAVDEDSEYEEVIIRKRVSKDGVHSTVEEPPREKPPVMLVLAGLTGLAALVAVVYITMLLYQPQEMFKAPVKHTTKTTATDTNPRK